MKRTPFAYPVIHGAKRLSRAAKKDLKRSYLRIINALAVRGMNADRRGPPITEAQAWRHTRRLRVEVSFRPTGGAA